MAARLRAALLTATVVIGLPTVLCASDYPIDLATHPGSVSVTVSPGRSRPVVLHRVPGRHYKVDILLETVMPEPLPVPNGLNVPAGPFTAIQDACAALRSAVDAVVTPKTEVEVGTAAATIARLLAETKCGVPGGTADTQNVVGQARQILEKYANSLPFDEYDLKSGQRLTITVARLAASGEAEKSWTTVLTTGARGEWLTSYAFTFAPLQDDLFKLDAADTKTGEPVKYTITKQRAAPGNGERFVPAVMFSWLPRRWSRSLLSVSPAAGLGANPNGPAFLLGAEVRYNANLAFVVGGAYVQQRRLSRAFEEGQVITTNLTDDQLHEKAWRRTLFWGFSLRFGTNPFKTQAAEPADPPKEPKKAK
ncbi:MAG: hypothetical protein JSU08_19340 [Acidobacteria bacterium]|nr:hypothetical protein [Acidobacteriota bacterium]